MKNISQIIKTNKNLFKNFTSLSLLQISNYIFPVITLPYLVRILGPEKYGLVNFAAAFTGYFTILTDYGFNLSATQEISVNRDDKQKVSEIFSSVITLKIFFFISSTLLFFSLTIILPALQSNMFLLVVTFFGVLGTALFPLWFYQGMEQMKYILIIYVSVRFVTTILIFVIVNTESDFIKYAGLNTVTQFVIAIIGLTFALHKFGIKYTFPSQILIKQQLKKGWELFYLQYG